jgi:hypothetical protein
VSHSLFTVRLRENPKRDAFQTTNKPNAELKTTKPLILRLGIHESGQKIEQRVGNALIGGFKVIVQRVREASSDRIVHICGRGSEMRANTKQDHVQSIVATFVQLVARDVLYTSTGPFSRKSPKTQN